MRSLNKTFPNLAIFAIFLWLAPTIAAAAACHVITPSGSGSKSGSDWSNACAGFAGSCATMTRGDTYFVANGSYNLGNFAAASGTTVTYVKKAVPTSVTGNATSAHCTDTGWSDSSFGGGQAKFGDLSMTNGESYVTIDGQVGAGTGQTAYGIFVDDSSCTGNCIPIELQVFGSAGARNITFRYIEVKGSGATTSSAQQEHFFHASSLGGGTAASNILISHTYLHDSWCNAFQTRGVSNWTVEYSYIVKTRISSECHGEAWSENHSTNLVTRYNQFIANQGTGVLVTLSDGYGGTTNSWDIYGNVFMDYVGGQGQMTNGTITCINSGITCTNYTVVNNTFANFAYTGGANAVGFGGDGAGSVSNLIFRNNLFYNISSSVPITTAGTSDYNTILASGSRSLSGTGNVVDTSSTNPFVNGKPSSPLPGDFHLASQNSSWSSGLSLASLVTSIDTFNLDPDGVIRGSSGSWSRGAYEYVSSTAGSTPPPPTGLVATVD